MLLLVKPDKPELETSKNYLFTLSITNSGFYAKSQIAQQSVPVNKVT